MFNYYENIVWNIDKALLALCIVFSVVLAIYSMVVSYSENKRRRNLLAIKKNVQALALSGQQPTGDTCPAVETGTNQRFLDVEMERERVLFNETEKQFIRKCFASPEKITSLKKIAAGAGNKWRRIEAILSLGYAGDVPSLGILKEAALDKDEDVAYYAFLALGLVKNIESAKILLALLKMKPANPFKIASILGDFPPAIVDEAAKLMEDADPIVRLWAVSLVAKFRTERYSKQIEHLTKDESTDVRAAACGCLGGIGKSDSRAALLQCLKDRSWVVRMNAVRSLSKLAGAESMGEISDLINEESLPVKEAVKNAMAAHIVAALPYISKILSGSNELAKKEAVEALEISGYVTTLLQDAVSDDPKRKEEAVNMLKAMFRASAHFGIETGLAGLAKPERDRALEVLRGIDKRFAEHVIKKIKREIPEL